MKTSEELKKELHEYIDSINDEETLWMVREDLMEYLEKDFVEENHEDDLTGEENKRLDEAIRQADTSETFPWKELKASLEEWRKK